MPEALEVIKFSGRAIPFHDMEIPMEGFIKESLGNVDEYGWSFSAGDPEFWKFSDRLLVPGGTALDLGSAFGRTALPFLLRGMAVVGYENNPAPNNLTRAVTEELKLPFDLREEDITQANLGSNQYDTVLLGQTFLHFPSKKAAFEVLSRAVDALKPNGHLWLRAAGKDSSSYRRFLFYSTHMGYGAGTNAEMVDEDVFLNDCACSGEWLREPFLFFDPIELMKQIAEGGLGFVHTQIATDGWDTNIMYGENWNKEGGNGFITILAQKP